MDFRVDEAAVAVRAEARALFDQFVTPEVRARVRATGTVYDHDLHRAIGERGWLTASWSLEEGGAARNAVELAPFFDEGALVDAPLDAILTTALVTETLREVGTDAQKRDIVPRFNAGDVIICLGFSEPDAGSDVAAARTNAVRDGDVWTINGQKMFTTMAHGADYVFLLTRTNSDVPKHRGLTLFLVPMDTPGIEVHPVATLGRERTNITFYNDVQVPDSARVGDVDGGWSVMQVTLALERGSFPNQPGRCDRVLALAVEWANTPASDGRAPIESPNVRRELARLAVRNEVGRLLGIRAVWVHSQRVQPVIEGSMAKLFATEHLQEIAQTVIGLIGAEGLLSEDAPGALLDGAIEEAYRHAPVETIYGGTSEIQRDIIARHGLGLPRSG